MSLIDKILLMHRKWWCHLIFSEESATSVRMCVYLMCICKCVFPPFKTPVTFSLSPRGPTQFLSLLWGQVSLSKDFIRKVLFLKHTYRIKDIIFSKHTKHVTVGPKVWDITWPSSFCASLFITSEWWAASVSRQLQRTTLIEMCRDCDFHCFKKRCSAFENAKNVQIKLFLMEF